jgi:hypothetical protein
MSSLGFSLDIEEELWDSTKLSFVTMFTISIYKKPKQSAKKEGKKERKKEGSKTKKEDWFGESEIMLECRVVFS